MTGPNPAELDRRTLLRGAAAGVAAGSVAALLDTPEAAAQNKNALKDPGIVARTVSFKSGQDTIQGFLARPKTEGKFGAVVLMPGIFGVTDYMKETTAQVAQAGLVGLCLDFYSRQGGTPQTNDFAQLRAIVGRIPDKQILDDLQAAIDYLKQQDYTNGKYGITGFCMGGRYTLLLAAHSRDIVAAAPFYGPVTAAGPDRMAAMDYADRIRAAVQGHYGATDMNPKPEDVRAFYAKLKQTNPHAEFFIYEGAGHAFHDWSRPSYHPEAAALAWQRTLEFFRKHLS